MRDNGKHVSIMGHFSHYQELGTVTLEAVRRLREEAVQPFNSITSHAHQ